MMEKLVRDRIPEIMKRNGVDPQVREANQGERLRLLLAKLHEEASELGRVENQRELITPAAR